MESLAHRAPGTQDRAMTSSTPQNFIGGRWQESRGGGTDPVLDPATGEVITDVASSNAADVDAAVAAAAEAFAGWAATAPGQRAAALQQLADRLEEHADELVSIESRNVGKPIAAVPDEIGFLVDNLRYFGAGARSFTTQAPGEYLSGYTSILRREPLGVVASIAPWNYPLMMAAWKIGPALAAGNTVVLKPSELTPLTALKMAELAADIFPPGVLNVITGDGEHCGAALVAHPSVAIVSLTGEVTTGKAIMRAAADTLKRVHLELGGKAPVVVFDDADLEAVVAGVRLFGYFNAGPGLHSRHAGHHRPRHLRRLRERAGGRREEPDRRRARPTPAPSSGPVISAEQRERVSGFVDRAKAGGATIVTGGASDTGRRVLLRAERGRPTSRRTPRSSSARCSGRSSPCSGSPTRRRRSPGPTASTTGWPRACGPATSAERCA